ncbi:MAG: hypothetical protein ACR2HA_08505 [Nocardioides sp.]
MSWDDRLLAVFDDLEQQADGLALAERDVAVADLGRAAYSAVDLASRLRAAVGRELTLDVQGVGKLAGRVARAGIDFVVLESPGSSGSLGPESLGRLWVVRCAALGRIGGLSDQAVGNDAGSLSSRLGLGSVLRGFAAATVPVSTQTIGGALVHGRVRRVGADFVELWTTDTLGSAGQREWELVPFAAIAVLRPAPGG